MIIYLKSPHPQPICFPELAFQPSSPHLPLVAFLYMSLYHSNSPVFFTATTYVARHTFSTLLKRTGASAEYIQEALGHTDIKTTENYLNSFEKEIKKELANKLIAFKK